MTIAAKSSLLHLSLADAADALKEGAISSVALTQAAVPRTAASDYPTHTDSASAAIGAEYLVHSIPTEQQMLPAGRYLVIEVGVFPNRGQNATVSDVQFHLVVNGKRLHDAATPGTVAGSLKYNDWEQQRGLQSMGQMGPVVMGPQQTGRFPGDPVHYRAYRDT